MKTEHPITPPPELYKQWEGMPRSLAFEAAYRAGADQELEACCEWLHWQNLATHQDLIPSLRAARRPKPPSLKEQALQALCRFDDTKGHEGLTLEQIAEDFVLIRRAVESLPDV